jgi:hypothetical protein
MSKQRTDREGSTPALPFPTPPGFGEPVAHLIIAVNAQGQPHICSSGDPTQVLFLGAQGLNYAISGLVVASLQQSLAHGVLPWPTAQTGGRS